MLKAFVTYGNEGYLDSAEKGGNFIIISQQPAPQAGWAQQYNYMMEPAWARSFEPPGICSCVTARNIKTLIHLYLDTHNDRYLTPIPDAILWLENSNIGENLWARIYEITTNVPIYGDRTKGNKVYYDYEELSEIEKASYLWRGKLGVQSNIKYYQETISLGEKAFEERTEETTIEDSQKRAKSMESRIERIISSVDDGRWISDNMITCYDFSENYTNLLEYISLFKDIPNLDSLEREYLDDDMYESMELME
jgi:hypothetical protein